MGLAPAQCLDANGGSFGGGNPSTPRNGLHARDNSRSPRGKTDKMEDDGLLRLRMERRRTLAK